jgi:hypothetical protein
VFKRERAVFHFFRATNALWRGDPAAAITLTKKMMSLRRPKPYHIAFLAQSYVANNDRHNSRFRFREALEMTRNASKDDERYVHQYCLVFLTLMDSDDQVDQLVKDAVEISCRPFIKNLLPLKKEHSRLRVALPR